MAAPYRCTVWTDFGVPKSRFFPTLAEAQAYGEYCLEDLGCWRYEIRRDGSPAIIESVEWSAA
jgi:hypothetical protein